MMKGYLHDIFTVSGVGAIVYGCAMLHDAVAFIVAGVFVATIGIVGAIRCR